jgi:hypothetical protein
MFIALVVVTVLLAAICLNSAAMKLRQHEQVVAVICAPSASRSSTCPSSLRSRSPAPPASC